MSNPTPADEEEARARSARIQHLRDEFARTKRLMNQAWVSWNNVVGTDSPAVERRFTAYQRRIANHEAAVDSLFQELQEAIALCTTQARVVAIARAAWAAARSSAQPDAERKENDLRRAEEAYRRLALQMQTIQSDLGLNL